MSDRTQRLALWILALLLVGGTGLALRFARGYRPLAGLPGASSSLPADVGIRFDGITVVGRHKNRRAWTLAAGRIETTRARSRVTFSGGIHATLLPENNRPAATVTAPRAVYDAVARVLQVTGDVVCRAGSLQVSTPSAVWEIGSSQIRCPGSVRATVPRGEVRGEQLTLDIRSREFSLRNVRGRFRVDETQDFVQ